MKVDLWLYCSRCHRKGEPMLRKERRDQNEDVPLFQIDGPNEDSVVCPACRAIIRFYPYSSFYEDEEGNCV